MSQALRVLWKGIVQFERYSWLYVSANIVSILLSIPIITAPAAYAGLSYLSHTAQTTATATFSDFWTGFRLYFWRGLIAGLANVVVLGMLWVNLIGYQTRTDPLFVVLRTLWILILFVWLGMQLYLWPMLEEMRHPTLYGGLRNAGVLILQNPGFTLALLAGVGILIVLSTMLIVPWILFTNSLIASIANAAVLDRLAIVRARAQE